MNYPKRRIQAVLIVFACIGVNIILVSKLSIFKLQYWETLDSSVVPLWSSVSQDFQLIGNGSIKSYAYSAYFHKQGVTGREGISVIVVAGLPKNSTQDIFCQLYDKHQVLIAKIKGVLKPLADDNTYWKLPYHPYYIICQCKGIADVIPSFVSVLESEQTHENRTNLLRITYNTEQKYNFSLCVQPFYYNYDSPFKFVEWMEYYILMGVEKFTFYNLSIGPQTSCLMKSYGSAVEILPFSSPYEFHKDIILGAQSLSNNECLQRYRGLTKYLLIVDVDEMIMPASPSSGNNFSEMIRHINNYMAEKKYSVSEISGYKILNKFFCLDWSVDKNVTSPLKVSGLPNSDRVLQHLQMSTKLLREAESETRRTKSIIIPDLAVEIAIHYIKESIGDTQQVIVPDKMAYIHHYRKCTESMTFNKSCENNFRVMDNSAQRFAEAVAIRVSQRLFRLAKYCNVDVDS